MTPWLGPLQLLGADRAAILQARAEIWEQRLRDLARAFRTPLASLPPRKSAVEKLRLAAAMKMTTSVSNGWLAQRLQTGAVGSLGSLLTRFRAAGGTSRRDFKSALSQILT